MLAEGIRPPDPDVFGHYYQDDDADDELENDCASPSKKDRTPSHAVDATPKKNTKSKKNKHRSSSVTGRLKVQHTIMMKNSSNRLSQLPICPAILENRIIEADPHFYHDYNLAEGEPKIWQQVSLFNAKQRDKLFDRFPDLDNGRHLTNLLRVLEEGEDDIQQDDDIPEYEDYNPQEVELEEDYNDIREDRLDKFRDKLQELDELLVQKVFWAWYDIKEFAKNRPCETDGERIGLPASSSTQPAQLPTPAVNEMHVRSWEMVTPQNDHEHEVHHYANASGLYQDVQETHPDLDFCHVWHYLCYGIQHMPKSYRSKDPKTFDLDVISEIARYLKPPTKLADDIEEDSSAKSSTSEGSNSTDAFDRETFLSQVSRLLKNVMRSNEVGVLSFSADGSIQLNLELLFGVYFNVYQLKNYTSPKITVAEGEDGKPLSIEYDSGMFVSYLKEFDKTYLRMFDMIIAHELVKHFSISVAKMKNVLQERDKIAKPHFLVTNKLLPPAPIKNVNPIIRMKEVNVGVDGDLPLLAEIVIEECCLSIEDVHRGQTYKKNFIRNVYKQFDKELAWYMVLLVRAVSEGKGTLCQPKKTWLRKWHYNPVNFKSMEELTPWVMPEPNHKSLRPIQRLEFLDCQRAVTNSQVAESNLRNSGAVNDANYPPVNFDLLVQQYVAADIWNKMSECDRACLVERMPNTFLSPLPPILGLRQFEYVDEKLKEDLQILDGQTRQVPKAISLVQPDTLNDRTLGSYLARLDYKGLVIHDSDMITGPYTPTHVVNMELMLELVTEPIFQADGRQEPMVVHRRGDCIYLYKPPYWVMDNQDPVQPKNPIYLSSWILAQADKGEPWAQGYISKLKVDQWDSTKKYMKTFINRLDKDTSGIVVMPLTPQAKVSLKRSLWQRKWNKRYLALCWGIPSTEEGRCLSYFLKENYYENGRFKNANLDGTEYGYVYDDEKDGQGEKEAPVPKRALTFWKAVWTKYVRVGDIMYPITLMDVQIVTGRTHQIRVHMAEDLGMPLVFDGKYGEHNLHPDILVWQRAYMDDCTGWKDPNLHRNFTQEQREEDERLQREEDMKSELSGGSARDDSDQHLYVAFNFHFVCSKFLFLPDSSFQYL